MKKWILIIVLTLVVSVLVSYILIPSTLSVNKFVAVKVTTGQAWRTLSSEAETIFNGGNSTNSKNKEWTFSVEPAIYSQLPVKVQTKDQEFTGMLEIFPKSADSIWLNWKFSVDANNANPLTQYATYQLADEIDKKINKDLLFIKKLLEEKEDFYRKHIKFTTVKDTVYISSRFITRSFPTTLELYTEIDSLRSYAVKAGATIVGPPMLNASETDTGYANMIAFPIQKAIEAAPPFALKRMIKGRIIYIEATGGNESAENAFKDISNYVSDRKINSPAIPFYSLITDRRSEPDSSKWITRIYYPIL